MKFVITNLVRKQFPEYRLGLVIVRRMDNTPSNPSAKKILKMLRKEEKKKREKFTLEALEQDPHIIAWSEAFQRFGMGKKFNSSVKALALRVIGGHDLPDINPLVNLYNYVSLKHLIPFGGENLDATFGDAQLSYADGSEEFYGIGAEKNKAPKKDEVVWRDGAGITCRAWNWRQSDRTKVTDNTAHTYHVVDILPPYEEDEMVKASEDFAQLAEELLDAECEVYYADKDNPEIEFDFEQTYRPIVPPDKREDKGVDKETEGSLSSEAHTQRAEDGYPHQPTALDIHTRGTSLKNYILYPGSIGLLVRNAIVRSLQSVWDKRGLDKSEFPVIEIEHPADLEHGDWSCNVAMQLAKKFKQSPMQIADELQAKLSQAKLEQIERIEVVQPGFINFHLNKEWLLSQVPLIKELGDHYGQTLIRDNKTIMIEHTQPNTHKALHVGHLRNTILGMAEVRFHQATAYKVISTSYAGDVGPHVAKCIWGLQDEDLSQYQTLEEKVVALQDAYVKGNKAEKENEKTAEQIKEINTAIYNRSDPDINTLWETTRRWSIEKQESIYERIGSVFDRFYWESEVWEDGLRTVKENIGTVFEESEGAIIFDGEKHGLHKRVFITSRGTAPYEAKDLGLQQLKLKEYKFDFNVIQTGNDQAEYFKVMLKALELIYPEYEGVFENEPFGMVNVPSGKMSSREGNVILLENIIDDMHQRAYQEIDKRYPDMGEEKKTTIAEMIGLGATKYAMLKFDPKQDITFDPDITLSFSGDSGPYLQYVCVRIQSMIDKAKDSALEPDYDMSNVEQLTPEESGLLRKLYQLPEIIIKAMLEYKPNYLCAYLFDVAQAYNSFYLACPVLKADRDVAQARLALSQTTQQVLKNGLALLGISIPDKM